MKKVTAFFSMLAFGLSSTFVSCVHKINAVKTEEGRAPSSFEEFDYAKHHENHIQQKGDENPEK